MAHVSGAGDTIVALSSGALPAGIAVVRSSGPRAAQVARLLAGDLPEPRVAGLRILRDPETGDAIDRALLIHFPGPRTATGEDLVEYHCHGGRATVAALLAALAAQTGVREAEAGEFTRRALANGIIDLTAAEGLADLLAAETELQRKVALRRAEGAVLRAVEAIRDDLLALAAAVELAIDYVDEEDGGAMLVAAERFDDLLALLENLLDAVPAERLRDGIRIVVAGPPNAGKSSLINQLSGEERAIVTAIPGTTRDVIEVPVSLGGIPIVLSDTAGLRVTDEPVERIGIDRAERAIGHADIVLWLGASRDAPPNAILVRSKADLPGAGGDGIAFSAMTGEGREELVSEIIERARALLPASDVSLTAREREAMAEVAWHVRSARDTGAPEVSADSLRRAREVLDRVTGRSGVDDLLDSLFSRFCVGK